MRAGDSRVQVFQLHAHNLLARVIQIGNIQFPAFAHARAHSAGVVGRNHHQIRRERQICECELGGMSHRARVKRGNLRIAAVGVREERSGEFVLNFHNATGVHTHAIQPGAVFAEILPHRAKHRRLATKERMIVSDVRRGAATVTRHAIGQKAQAERFKFVRQNMVLEITRKGHQIIKCNRA